MTDVLTEHFSVIVAADILRGETLKHLPGVNQNQVPLDTYIPLAREIVIAVLTECQRFHERLADQVSFDRTEGNDRTTIRVLELVKSDMFIKMIKEIKKSADGSN
jgi:hypothetical protein